MTERLVIAIDGPAASGKSTTARLVARCLGYLYIDTGAMYRAMALAARRRGIPLSDVDSIVSMAEGTGIRQEQTANGVATYLDGRDVSAEIRSPEISRLSSDISTIRGVRRRLVRLQQEMGAHGGVVAEGRDIGTVVFPDAGVKIFMQASLDERARRRQAELRDKGHDSEIDELMAQIGERDRQDSSRNESPLICAPDAVVIDTSGKSIEDQVEEVLRAVRARTGEGGA